MNFLTTGHRILKKHVWNDLSSFFEKNYEQEACNPCERRHVQESLGDHQNILSGYNTLNRDVYELHLEQAAMGAYTSASWFWINCECGGIVRNDIFPGTLPHKYPYFSPFV